VSHESAEPVAPDVNRLTYVYKLLFSVEDGAPGTQVGICGLYRLDAQADNVFNGEQ
jgi:hypothetical protein